jgi:hypothetical protein
VFHIYKQNNPPVHTVNLQNYTGQLFKLFSQAKQGWTRNVEQNQVLEDLLQLMFLQLFQSSINTNCKIRESWRKLDYIAFQIGFRKWD